MSDQPDLALPAGAASQIRQLLKDRIADVLAAFDAHDAAGLVACTRTGRADDLSVPPTYVCPCGMQGTEGEWELHLAEALGDAITVELVGILGGES